MLRHVCTVLISAVVSSFLGTIDLVGMEGGAGSLDPPRFILGFAGATLMFTIPGAVLLMAAAFILADRAVNHVPAAILLVAIGVALGTLMLSIIEQRFTIVGAIFGGLTAAAFIAALFGLKGYPFTSR